MTYWVLVSTRNWNNGQNCFFVNARCNLTTAVVISQWSGLGYVFARQASTISLFGSALHLSCWHRSLANGQHISSSPNSYNSRTLLQVELHSSEYHWIPVYLHSSEYHCYHRSPSKSAGRVSSRSASSDDEIFVRNKRQVIQANVILVLIFSPAWLRILYK